VEISAYKGMDGTVAIVAINGAAADAVVPLNISGGTAPASMTPNVTSATEDLKAGTAVPVTAGVLMASLPSKSVTTFVGK
jgi:O-glycosyl hydrolase